MNSFRGIAKYCFLALFLLPLNLYSQPKCKIEHYSTEDGLSHNAITCILKDHEGFMWFGTWDGLNRYDGHRFVSFKSSVGDMSDLKNNRIDQISEDGGNVLWLKSYDGIYRFDKQAEQFMPLSKSLSKKLNEKAKFENILSATQHTLWLKTFNYGLVYFPHADVSLKDYITYNTGQKGAFKLPSDTVTFFHADKNGLVWIGTKKGLVCLKKDSEGRYSRINLSGSTLPNVEFNAVAENNESLFFTTASGALVTYVKNLQRINIRQITGASLNGLCLSKKGDALYASSGKGELFAITLNDLSINKWQYDVSAPLHTLFEDRTGAVWIEPEKKGVIRFDPIQKSFTFFAQKNDAAYNSNGNHFTVFEDNKGVLWVNMKGGGFGYYDTSTKRVEPFYNGQDLATHRFSNIVTWSYYDPAGILWFSTDERGINKVVFQANDFDQHLLVPQSLLRSDNEVRGVFNDRKNRLWLGLKSSKLYVIDQGKQLNNTFINEPAEGFGLVYTIMQDSKGSIWLGTKSNGLFKADPVNKEETKYKLTHFLHDKNDANSISSNEIYSLLEDSKGRLWAGSFESGLNLINQENGRVQFEHNSPAFANYPKSGFDKVRHLSADKDGNLWVATTDGLLVIDLNHGSPYRIFKYRKIPGDAQSLGNNDVQFIYRDAKNTMWLATAGGGLEQAIISGGINSVKFKSYTVKDGLPNDCLLSCVEDKRGYLWIATQKGLARLDPQRQKFKNFDSGDGLPTGDFSEAAALRLPDGKLVFGSVKGYLLFNPGHIVNQRIRSNLVFTNLQVNNEDVKLNAPDKLLNFNINNASKLVLHHNQNIISIDYTMLDYRSNNKQSYAYRLMGFDTVWHNNQDQKRATYTALPAGNYVFEVQCLNNDLYINTPVNSLAITILPAPWRTWWAYLIYAIIAIVIIECIRRVALTVLKLRHRIAVEHKLAELKMSFFTNVSHELRTPLTLIINPIEQIFKKENLSAEGRQDIDVVRKNANRMIRFINQLLELRKTESGKANLRVSQVELIALVKNVGEYFIETAREKSIKLQIDAEANFLNAWVDAEKLDTILYNVLANAFKFSPSDTTIKIGICELKASGKIQIQVTDQGPGVDKNKLKDIFELYYEGGNTDRNIKGTGIGLALSKELMKLQHGDIVATNNPAGGLTITIILNTGKAHFAGTDIVFAEEPVVPAGVEMAIQQLFLSENNSSDIETTVVKEGPLVLLVEDNADLRNFLKRQLNEIYRVETACDGEDGLEKALKLLPDLVISDVMMPKMNGIQLLDQLKHHVNTSHIPVILLTAKFSVENQIEGLKYGADYYITKPFHNDFLFEAVKNLLDQRRKLFEHFVQDGKKRIELKPSEINITSKDEEFLKDVIRIVEEGMPDTEFNIDDVAEKIGMARSTFFKKFKSLTDQAPVEFVRDMRLQRARQYLDAGETNIAIIAYTVGFNNAKYFSTCFREKYKTTPSEYLKSRSMASKQ